MRGTKLQMNSTIHYRPQSSRNERKKMLNVPLNFENEATIETLVDSGAFVSAIAQNELDRNKQQALANIFKLDGPHTFQIQVENGQLEKPVEQPHLNLILETIPLQNISS